MMAAGAVSWEMQALPSNVIVVSNIPQEMLTEDKTALIELLCLFGDLQACDIDVQHSRVRAVYSMTDEAVYALSQFHAKHLCGSLLRAHYTVGHAEPQPDRHHLAVPAAPRQFLISPPPSPPIGWEPSEEDAPVVNYELLHAIAEKGRTGEALTLVPGSSAHPEITVQDFSDNTHFSYPIYAEESDGSSLLLSSTSTATSTFATSALSSAATATAATATTTIAHTSDDAAPAAGATTVSAVAGAAHSLGSMILGGDPGTAVPEPRSSLTVPPTVRRPAASALLSVAPRPRAMLLPTRYDYSTGLR